MFPAPSFRFLLDSAADCRGSTARLSGTTEELPTTVEG